MKNIKHNYKIIINSVLLLILTACAKEELKYNTSFVSDFSIQLNGEPWSLNTGISTKPIFIYKEDGSFFANYSSHYRFILEDGKYHFLATDIPEAMITSPTNLNELVIPQSIKADQAVNLSAAVPYSAPFKDALTMDIITRTGILRLNATDTKADKSYSVIKASVGVKRTGYYAVDETFEEGELTLSRAKATTSGGINYTDDFFVFKTDTPSNAVTVRFDFMNQDSVVLKTKTLAGNFNIYSDSITAVAVELNNTDEPIIQDYQVTVTPADWSDESFNPQAPIDIPDGYRYVAPSENIQEVYNAMVADATVSEIKLFLKANETYQLGRINITKPLDVKGQVTANGRAILTMGRISRIEGDIDFINFENLTFEITDAYAYDFDLSVPFHVNQIKYKDCTMNNLSRALWRNDRNESLQLVDNFSIDDCVFMNFADGDRNYAFINIADNNTISNISITNSTFEILKTGFHGPIIGRLQNHAGADISINVQNCTFSLLGDPAINPFDFSTENINSLNLNFENNLFTGVSNNQGVWLTVDDTTAGTQTITNNYRAGDFIMSNWGVDPSQEPIASSNRADLFEDDTTGNLIIKDKSSAVYTNTIGDPRWIE
ncbi:DUF5123 domain-containing protein [Wenyingzhuangia sp. IMCC45467]